MFFPSGDVMAFSYWSGRTLQSTIESAFYNTEPFKEHRNQESIPSLVESILRNRFLGVINVYKYGLRVKKLGHEKCTYWRGIGLFKSWENF
jgi:hypothetical protein